MQDITPLVLIVVFAAVVNIAVAVAVFYFPRRWLVNRLPMPVAIWVLLVTFGLLATWGLLALAISLVLKQPIGYSFGIAFGIFCGVIFTGLLVCNYDKSAAGSLLLDCGPYPKKKTHLFGAVFLLLNGASGVAHFVGKFDIAATVVVVFAVLPAAICCLVLAFGRLQIRENGIWKYCELLKWHQLQSYHWEGANDCSLRLQVRTLAFLERGAVPLPALPVSLEQKASIEEFLQKHCPMASDA